MLPDDMEPVVGVSEFVELVNQTFDYVFSTITISGELANLRVSKGKWLYFDLKDEMATVKFFGTVYQLPGPLEDGMLLKVRGTPRLHNQYGFSVNVENIQPAGEGAIRRAAELLKMKLATEGLFDDARKRAIPYPPQHIGLITSAQSAAYADFIKVIGQRWGGLSIDLIDVQVQGEVAAMQVVRAIEQFNSLATPPEVLVIIRGGGSPEDLAAFNTEQVTRFVAGSRIPTLVAIGHEIDVCLAELAADRRASTPSNAAELLVPDRAHARSLLHEWTLQLHKVVAEQVALAAVQLMQTQQVLHEQMNERIQKEQERLVGREQLLHAFDPASVLARGYAIVRQGGHAIRNGLGLAPGDIVQVQLANTHLDATIKTITADK